MSVLYRLGQRCAHLRTLDLHRAFAIRNSHSDTDKYSHLKDQIFDTYKDPVQNRIPLSFIFKTLSDSGLRSDHPRIRLLNDNISRVLVNRKSEDSLHDCLLDRETFKECISPSIELLNRALQKKLVIPEWNSFTSSIGKIFNDCAQYKDGSVADYIPELKRSSPDLWGAAVCTVDGQRESWGDAHSDFCIQSVSKPFTYAVVLDDYGVDHVHTYVGQEPSGRLFNEICLDSEKKPHNPMVNAGAIAVTSLLKPSTSLSERFGYIMGRMKSFSASGKLNFNNAVFLSERENADRNYAIGFYMREHKCFPEYVTDSAKFKEVLDLYFMLCSMETDAETLSVMAATLANGGVCPMNQERTVCHRAVRHTLTLMHSCGMYDYSGKFAFFVGIPSKSGVSGAMMIVVPNVLGMALYSPPLDPLGNSVRGVEFAKKLVGEFNFHNFDNVQYGPRLKVDPRHTSQHLQQQISNLFFAVRNGDISEIKRYLLKGYRLDEIDYDDRTVLHVAASEGLPHILHYLLENWPTDSVDMYDRYGRTPLDDAIAFDHKKCAAHLKSFMDKRGSQGSELKLTKGCM
uniref:glutaminase n=1 Tax=Steinernema glaseri TaxID=37863 RepID=A0A1I7ZXF7_9BILA